MSRLEDAVVMARQLSHHLSTLSASELESLESMFRRFHPVQNCDEGMLFRAISRYCNQLKGCE